MNNKEAESTFLMGSKIWIKFLKVTHIFGENRSIWLIIFSEIIKIKNK